MFLRLRLPYAMPYIFAGLRIATTLAVIGTAFFALMSWIERLISWRTDLGDSTTQA